MTHLPDIPTDLLDPEEETSSVPVDDLTGDAKKAVQDVVKKAEEVVKGGATIDDLMEYQKERVKELEADVEQAQKNHDDALKEARKHERLKDPANAVKYRNIARAELANKNAMQRALIATANEVTKIMGDSAKKDGVYLDLGDWS